MLKEVALITFLQTIVCSFSDLAHCAIISQMPASFSHTEIGLEDEESLSVAIIDELENDWTRLNQGINLTSNAEVISFLELAEILQVSALEQDALIQNSNNLPVQLSIETPTLPFRNRANNYQRPQQVQLPQAKPLPGARRSRR